MTKKFKGWYFKHQYGNDVVAFIPGTADSGNFIQVIADGRSEHFDIKNLTIRNNVIMADKCFFSRYVCHIDLPGIIGTIKYRNTTPLRSDIMGPFRRLPMQCRHGIVSMDHDLYGNLRINGRLHNFTGGKGYIEKDSGTSFPQSYQWLQCNNFSKKCSLMVSIAHIPFCCTSFTGCICAIIYNGVEYRFATYSGVKILVAQADHICLLQGNLLLEIDIRPSDSDYDLKSPKNGLMSGLIKESCNARIHVRLWKNKVPVMKLFSSHAMYEYVKAPIDQS